MIVVPDSNIFIAQIVPLDYTEAAEQKLNEWLESGTELVVPSLWSYEIVSALRKAMTVGLMTQDQAEQQPVAYDAAFLALADSLGADFWTADKRLFNASQSLQLQWVYSLQEPGATESPGS